MSNRHVSRLVPPSAGRLPPKAVTDVEAVVDGKTTKNGYSPSSTAGRTSKIQHAQYQPSSPRGEVKGRDPMSHDYQVIMDGDYCKTDPEHSKPTAADKISATNNYVSLEFDPALGCARSGSPSHVTSKPELAEHIQVYTNWANHYLSKLAQVNHGSSNNNKTRGTKFITNLQTDLADGVLLAQLINAVVGEKVANVDDRMPAQSSTEALSNIDHCLIFLNHCGVSTDGIRSKDILSGSLRSILNLLFNLSHYKQQYRQIQPPRAAAGSNHVVESHTIASSGGGMTSRLPMSNGVKATAGRGHDQLVNDANTCADAKPPHGAIQRSSGLHPNAGTQSSPATAVVKQNNSPSMLDKLKLFGSKNQKDSTKEQVVSKTLQHQHHQNHHQQQHQTPANDMSAATVPRATTMSHADSRLARPPTRGSSSSAVGSSANRDHVMPPTANGVHAQSIGYNHVNGVACSVPSVASPATNGHVPSSSKISKVPSRSLPRSQTAISRSASGRRSVEPLEHLRTTPSTVQSVPGSRAASSSSLAAAGHDTPARNHSTTEPRKGASSKLAAPSSAQPSRTSGKPSRSGSSSGSVKVQAAVSRDTLPTAASAASNATVPNSKSRCQSASGSISTSGRADDQSVPTVSTKSSVATVRQLAVDTTVTDASRPTTPAFVNEILASCQNNGVAAVASVPTAGAASAASRASMSRMPRLSSASRVPSATSRSVSKGTSAAEPGTPTVQARRLPPEPPVISSTIPPSIEAGSSSTRPLTDDGKQSSLTKSPAVENIGSGDKVGSPRLDVTDVSTITPMQPMTSRSYLFTPSPLDSTASPTVRLLSANRRPFPPVTSLSSRAGTMCSGYVSDGDVQAGNQMNRYSGYLSEGGSTLYAARRAQQNFLDSINGMRKCMERGLAGVDDDDEDDSDDDDNECSSVTSADIDNAISADENDEHSPTPASAAGETGSSARHVAFISRPTTTTITPFERGSVARATLPAGSVDLGVTMATSMRQPSRLLQVSAHKQRSKSVGRTSAGTSALGSNTASNGTVSTPLATSTPNGKLVVKTPETATRDGAALSTGSYNSRFGSPAAETVAVDKNPESVKGERLSNYQQNTLLKYSVGSSTAGLRPSSGDGTVACTVPRNGRHSVDSMMKRTSLDWSSSSATIREGAQEALVDGNMMMLTGGAGSGTARYRTMRRTPGQLDPDYAVLQRPRLSSTCSRNAISDVESTGDCPPPVPPSRFSAGTSIIYSTGPGGRSLPRNGPSWTSGDQTTSVFAEHPGSVPKVSQQTTGRRPSYGALHSGSSGIYSQLSASRENMLHGSSLSLGSNSSSLYSTPEEMQVQEIAKLRRELEVAQAKISSLNNHLNTNAHVVVAFEQSLSNMTHRLQRLAAVTDQKDAELNELRSVINSLRFQNSMAAEARQQASHGAGSGHPSMPPTMRRHLSSDSIVSAGQQSVMTVASEVDRKKKKHKNWLTSFGKAFSRKKKNESISDIDSDTASIYTNTSMMSASPAIAPTTSVQSADLLTESNSEAVVLALQKQLHEKDLRLTDIQLEALSSAHQLQQLQDTINRMKNEMVSLRVDNDRLHLLVGRQDVTTEVANSNCSSSGGNVKPDVLSSHQSSSNTSQFDEPVYNSSRDLLSGLTSGSSNLQNIALSIKLQSPDTSGIPISKLSFDRKTGWDSLTSLLNKHFTEYMQHLDPTTSLGLDENSIHSYNIGDVSYSKDGPKPELLPCGYLVGDNVTISLKLKGAQQKAVDLLAYDTLVPKSIIQRYVSLLMEHRRIILCGSSGTGKTYLARQLAEHLILSAGKEVNESAIATYSVDPKTGRELRQYLLSIADKCERQQLAELPHVIILDGLHHVTAPLGDTFSGFLNVECQASPYIIGTMNQATGSTTNLQLHHNFRWILCANHMEPVQGFLRRYLRRQMIQAAVDHSVDCNQLADIIEWIPLVWQQLNRLLEVHNSTDVTVGPRLFMSCPMDASKVPTWFTDLWNYSIVPYMLEAVREGVQTYGSRAAWEDPVDWVVATCPWSDSTLFNWSTLQRIRPEDIGSESMSSSVIVTSSVGCAGGALARNGPMSDVCDPLMNMLTRLQEVTNSSSGSDMGSVNSQDLNIISIS